MLGGLPGLLEAVADPAVQPVKMAEVGRRTVTPRNRVAAPLYSAPMPIRRTLRLALKSVLLVLAFAVVLWEETVWRWARAIGALIARIPFIATLEDLVRRLDARLVFALFLIPIALLFPLKIAALWLIAHHQVFAGLALAIGAKLLGTAISARLYAIAEPRLLELPSFAWLHGIVTGLLARAHAYLDASPAWQAARATLRRGKEAAIALIRRARTLLAGQGGGLGLRLAASRRLLDRWRRRPAP